MRLQPIPKIALCDTCKVRTPVYDEDAYDGISGYSAPVTIRNVRWEAREALSPSQHVFADGSTGLMYVDRINSEGAFEIPAGSMVEVAGDTRQAVSCFPAVGLNGAIHHWEVELR